MAWPYKIIHNVARAVYPTESAVLVIAESIAFAHWGQPEGTMASARLVWTQAERQTGRERAPRAPQVLHQSTTSPPPVLHHHHPVGDCSSSTGSAISCYRATNGSGSRSLHRAGRRGQAFKAGSLAKLWRAGRPTGARSALLGEGCAWPVCKVPAH